MNENNIVFREEVTREDIGNVRRLVNSHDLFSASEVEVATGLVEERLDKGLRSDYYFIFAERMGEVIGYTCFGPIGCSNASYDIHWIVVQKGFHGLRLGKELLKRAENKIAEMGGRRIYVETSSQESYEPTRIFYKSCNYEMEASIKDFYSEGDNKLIYVKKI